MGIQLSILTYRSISSPPQTSCPLLLFLTLNTTRSKAHTLIFTQTTKQSKQKLTHRCPKNKTPLNERKAFKKKRLQCANVFVSFFQSSPLYPIPNSKLADIENVRRRNVPSMIVLMPMLYTDPLICNSKVEKPARMCGRERRR